VERSTVIAAKPAAIFPCRGPEGVAAVGRLVPAGPGDADRLFARHDRGGRLERVEEQEPGRRQDDDLLGAGPGDFEYRIEFPDMGMAATRHMALAPGADGTTKVRMGMEGDLGRNPLNRWFGLFMDRMMGPDFDAGLANLKKIGEAPAPIRP
jgi:hypothetical protein